EVDPHVAPRGSLWAFFNIPFEIHPEIDIFETHLNSFSEEAEKILELLRQNPNATLTDLQRVSPLGRLSGFRYEIDILEHESDVSLKLRMVRDMNPDRRQPILFTRRTDEDYIGVIQNRRGTLRQQN